MPFVGPATARRFLQFFESYLQATTREAGLREKDEVLDLVSYDILRRDNCAVRFCFEAFGYLIGADLPDEIFHHPLFRDMHVAATDMLTWSNVRSPVSFSVSSV